MKKEIYPLVFGFLNYEKLLCVQESVVYCQFLKHPSIARFYWLYFTSPQSIKIHGDMFDMILS